MKDGKKNTKQTIKTLAKILHVLAIIGRVFMYIGAFFLIVVMVIIPIVFSKIDITKRAVTIKDIGKTDIIVRKDPMNGLIVKYDGKTTALKDELDNSEIVIAETIYDKLSETTSGAIVVYLESSLVFYIASIIVSTFILLNLERFFKSLCEKEEIFTEDKPGYLKKAGILSIVSYAIALLSNNILGSLGTGLNTGKVEIFEILCFFLVHYIFLYAVGLDSKTVSEPVEKKAPAKKSAKQEK